MAKSKRYARVGRECVACGSCLKVCEAGAMSEDESHKAVIDPGRCTDCGCCVQACKLRAIVKRKGLFI